MYGRGRRRPRFSLLQLDYNESFFIDLGCILDVEEPAGKKLGLRGARRLKGRLKVGSWSLTFDPEDPETPLLRLPMREMPQPADAWDGDPDGGEGLEVRASLGYRRATADEPIEAVRLEEEGGGGGGCRLRFALLHTPLSLVLPLARGLHAALQLPAAEADARRAELADEHCQAEEFDYASLADPLEAHLLELRCKCIRPMLQLPAILLITESRVYVQAGSGSGGGGAAADHISHWPLDRIARAVRRRHLLRPTALELAFGGNGGGNE